MSRHYPLTPVERYCPNCDGYDVVGDTTCAVCGGIGRVFIAGGPLFGCQHTLANAKPGMIVTLGNGDRGRVVKHCMRGTPTTEIALIDPMFDTEDQATTRYPRATGVRSMSVVSWFQDPHGESRAKQDHLDPLQRTNAL